MARKVRTELETLTNKIIEGLLEKKGTEITVMDLRKIPGSLTDNFVICTATSDRHAQALADSVEEMVRKDLKEKPMNIEGHARGEWILLDYFNVVVHIFLRTKREFFNIEELWGDAEFKEIN
ncbi:MAG: ribosome silencing factor [Bacteroidia bacterium]|nr:ribosome silencing factor [Bacteroidia bacterium]